ncbi:MAG TPA: hypothetical protein VN030_11105 [Cellvibrio sp.]|nr:hypothetical protein [Cellvibrio sp.]
MNTLFRQGLLAALALSLAACGGSSGSKKSTATGNTTSSMASVTSSSTTVLSSTATTSSSETSSISSPGNSSSSATLSSTSSVLNSSATNVSSATSSAVAANLQGTAAIGAAISGTVIAIDINGLASPAATTSAEGAFIVDVTGMTAPFILTITGTSNGKQVSLNSIASSVGQTVNITPLTDLIVSTAAGMPGASALASKCVPVNNQTPQECLDFLTAATTANNLSNAVTAVKNMIAPLNTGNADPITSSFSADGTGMDKLLDQIVMAPALNQGETASITLIATNTPLGHVAMPATAGGTATPAVTTPSDSQLELATSAGDTFSEIKTCLSSFNALYEGAEFTPPNATRVEEFFDGSFNMGQSVNKDLLVNVLSGEGELAFRGFGFFPSGFTPYNMSQLSELEISTLSADLATEDVVSARETSAIGFTNKLPTSAWISVRIASDAGLVSMKMVKSTAYTGCPGGWKMAGTQHMDMHMNARITRDIDQQKKVSYRRTWSVHINAADVEEEDARIARVVVSGPGFSHFGGKAKPVGDKASIPLINGGEFEVDLIIDDETGYYQNSEELQSCQDLAASASDVPQGTFCVDETQAAPGKIYGWTFEDEAGNVLSAFPFQVNAVPISKAFAEANADALFARITQVTPPTLSSLNEAIANAVEDLEGLFSFSYTQQQNVYGSHMDNCHIILRNAEYQVIFVAERNALGHESSCTFTTDGLNSGSLAKPQGAVSHGSISVATSVLGNQAISSQPYPQQSLK